jgi:hypothetical protein
MNHNLQVPFPLTDSSLSEWLLGLSLEQSHASCRQLLTILQAIKDIDLTPQQLLIFLPKIGAKLDVVVDRLEKNYLDKGFPLDTEEETAADFVSLAFTALAERYLALARQLFDHPGLSGDLEKATVLYWALKALGQSLLHRSIVCSSPSKGFWIACYRIYKQAENAQLLDRVIAPGASKESTINTAFKRILLFELANPGQFRPREMKAIYHALEECANSSLIESDGAQSLLPKCTFNLSRDQRPQMLFSLMLPKNADAETRYFSSVTAARNLHQLLQRQFSSQNALKLISYSSFTRAIKSLSLTQKRKFNRKAEKLNKTCIVGFHHVVSYLFKMNRIDREEFLKKPRKDTRIAGDWEVPDLDLVPIEEGTTYQISALFKKNTTDNSKITDFLKVNRESSSSHRIWDTAEIEKSKRADVIPIGEVEILDSSAHGFQVLWKAAGVKVKVGEIVALPETKGDRVEIGLIRRISHSPRRELCLGIEIIGFESEAVGMVRPNQSYPVHAAIFLPGIRALKQEDSIIYDNYDFSTGEFIVIRREKLAIPCKLKKLINSTAAITQMELYYTSPSD